MLIIPSQIILKSIELYQKNWKHIFKYVGLLVIPSVLFFCMITLFSVLAFLQNLNIIALMLTYGIVGIVIVIISVWIGTAFIRAVADLCQEKNTLPIKEEMRASAPYIVPGILVTIIITLATLGGFILFIIPGFIVGLWYSFSNFAVMLENKKPRDAMKYSKQLIVGRWWGVLWRIFVPAFLFTIGILAVEFIIMTPLNIAVGNIAITSSVFIVVTRFGQLLSSIVGFFLTPLSTIASIILYIELKKTPVVRA